MRSDSEENVAASQSRQLLARDFIWFQVKDRTSGDPVFDGYWSDVGTITAPVIDPNTGGSTERTWFGAGGLISISPITLVSNLTVQNVTVTLSQVADRVNDLVRSYECKQGRVEIFRGRFDPDTRLLVAPARSRFVGFIDDIQIRTPEEGGDGAVTLTCTSHTQELTRTNSETRSHASQLARTAPLYDDFYVDTTVVGGWQFFWGRASGAADTVAAVISKVRA